MPKGNRSGKRGRPPRIGGKNSKGTIVKPVRFSVEMVKAIERKIGKGKSFSDYIRGCVETDLIEERLKRIGPKTAEAVREAVKKFDLTYEDAIQMIMAG